VSTAALRKPAVPRRLNCTDPQRWRPSAEGNPATNGCPSCTLLRPAGRHAMVVAHFFESGQRRRLRWGRVESAPLMAGAVALASTGYIAAIDEKAWAGPRRLGPGVPGFPQREPALPTETAREQSTRGARSSHPFGAGLDRSQLRPPGTGCSPANGPLRSLDDWLVPACYQ